MDFQVFLLATLTAHISFAIFVTAHASFTDRELGNWAYITLLLGLAGVAGYFFYEPPEERSA